MMRDFLLFCEGISRRARSEKRSILGVCEHLSVEQQQRNHPQNTKKTQKKESHITVTLLKEATPTFPQTSCSIIGAGGLNFSVRNGKRWDPTAIVTKISFVAFYSCRDSTHLTFFRMR